jgi:hypothetical protein
MNKKSILSAMLLGLMCSSQAQALTIDPAAASLPGSAAQDRSDKRLALLQRKPPKEAQPTQQQQPQQAQLAVPSGEAMLVMIRSSLLALSQANQTNNYAVLNALGSDNFRATNTPQRLAEIFAPFRANNIDLAPVALINPQLTAQPTVTGGRLRMVGFFPSQPMQVNFDLTYDPTPAGWKMQGISVNLSRAQQVAQAQPAQQPAAR